MQLLQNKDDLLTETFGLSIHVLKSVYYFSGLNAEIRVALHQLMGDLYQVSGAYDVIKIRASMLVRICNQLTGDWIPGFE